MQKKLITLNIIKITYKDRMKIIKNIKLLFNENLLSFFLNFYFYTIIPILNS